MKYLYKGLATLVMALTMSQAHAIEITIQLFSYVANGGTTSANWNLETDEGSAVASGTATFNMMTFQFTYNVEVEDGCYELEVTSNTASNLGQSNFLVAVLTEGNIIPPTEPVVYGNLGLTYSFCTGDEPMECDACFTPAVYEGQLTVNNCSTPVEQANTMFIWDFGDGTIGDGPMPAHQYTENGIYEVCLAMAIMVENQVVCASNECVEIEVTGLEENNCPDQIWSGPGDGCGWMNFEIGSFVEGESVTWYFNGWNSDPVIGGHFIEHHYNEPGLHVVCAYYTSPECPDGVELCTEIFVEECEGDCPELISVQEVDCDSFVFCIDDVDTGNVTWHFGDETSETSGPCADHSYQGDGYFVVTATYSGPGCPFGTTLQVTVLAECGGDCPNEIIATPHCDAGTVTYTVLGVPEEMNTEWLYGNEGWINTENASITLEIPNGSIFICAWSAAMQEMGCPEVCEELYVSCEEGCDLDLEVMQDEDCEVLVLQAYNVPDAAEIHWTQNGEFINTGNITTFLLEPGENLICASYETFFCGSITWCEVFEGCESGCPEEIWSGPGDGCGVMNFEIGSFVEGEEVTWYPGDESGAVEGGHFWSHTYAEPGVYNVCAYYTSPDCPDGVELCIQIIVESCEIGGDCPDDIAHSENECGFFWFEIGSFQDGESVDWYLGDVILENEGHYLEYQFDISGEIQVCAHYTSNQCPDGVWVCTTVHSELCGECTNVNFSLDSFVQEDGPEWVEWTLSNNLGMIVAEGGVEYSENDPWYDEELCLEDGCYTLHICASNEFNGEAFEIHADGGWEIVEITPLDNFLCQGYDVLLSLNSDCGGGDCEASFEPIFGIAAGHVEFDNNSYYDGSAQFMWDYGNGQQSYNENGNVWYTENGVYIVCLTIWSGDCTDTYCEEIVIDDFEDECNGTEINLVVETNYPGDGEDAWTITVTMNGEMIGTFPFVSCDECPEVFEIPLCVPDGCYEVEFNSAFGINAEEILIAAYLLGSEIPIGELEIGYDDETGSFQVGINDDCEDHVTEHGSVSWNLYPNPAGDELNLQINGKITGAEMFVMDATGRQVAREKITNSLHRMNVSTLADGIYTVRLMNNNETMVKQIVVSR